MASESKVGIRILLIGKNAALWRLRRIWLPRHPGHGFRHLDGGHGAGGGRTGGLSGRAAIGVVALSSVIVYRIEYAL